MDLPVTPRRSSRIRARSSSSIATSDSEDDSSVRAPTTGRRAPSRSRVAVEEPIAEAENEHSASSGDEGAARTAERPAAARRSDSARSAQTPTSSGSARAAAASAAPSARRAASAHGEREAEAGAPKTAVVSLATAGPAAKPPRSAARRASAVDLPPARAVPTTGAAAGRRGPKVALTSGPPSDAESVDAPASRPAPGRDSSDESEDDESESSASESESDSKHAQSNSDEDDGQPATAGAVHGAKVGAPAPLTAAQIAARAVAQSVASSGALLTHVASDIDAAGRVGISGAGAASFNLAVDKSAKREYIKLFGKGAGHATAASAGAVAHEEGVGGGKGGSAPLGPRHAAAQSEELARTRTADPIGLAHERKQRAAQARLTKGSKWFHLPAKEPTPEQTQALRLLRMRAYMDPKRFYKGAESMRTPEHFEVGTVIEGATEFISGRMTKGERKATLAQELRADTQVRKYAKRRYTELHAEGMAKADARKRARPGGRGSDKPAWARAGEARAKTKGRR